MRRQLNVCFAAALILLAHIASAAPISACQDRLPTHVRYQLAKQFPHLKVQDFADLAPEYQEMWSQTHASECPGLAIGRYEDEDYDSFSILLVSRDSKRPETRLLMVDPSTNQLQMLERIDVATSSPNVIYTLPPGDYSDAENEQTVHTSHDGVVLEQLEVGSILYFYRSRLLHKLSLSE